MKSTVEAESPNRKISFPLGLIHPKSNWFFLTSLVVFAVGCIARHWFIGSLICIVMILVALYFKGTAMQKMESENNPTDTASGAVDLTMTEGNQCRMENLDRTYQELLSGGVKGYTVDTCRDQRVCPACRDQHGKKYPIDQYQPGVTAPPFCDDCRCIVLPIFEVDGMAEIEVSPVDWEAVDKRLEGKK